MKNTQELNTMPMHDKPWGTAINPWRSQGTATKSRAWGESSTKLTTPKSISTAATIDQSAVSYDPYLSTHVFTKVNIDAPKPADNIWIGVSHVFLPTFWCSKCDSWSSHHDKIHEERIRWQTMKDAWQNKLNSENTPKKTITALLNNRTDSTIEMIITNA
jgi:hypothetical protein